MYTPPKGPRAELETLEVQSRGLQFLQAKPDALARAIATVAVQLPETRLPTWTRETFDQCVLDLKRESVPGYPYQLWASDVGKVLDNPAEVDKLYTTVVGRLYSAAAVDADELEETMARDPTFALRNELCDPARVIIKDEPTKAAKIAARKWRFIVVESLADQLVERMLFTNQNKAEIRKWEFIGSKPGMGMEDSHAEKVVAYVRAHGLNRSSDAAAWDSSVPYFMLVADVYRRYMCAIDGTPEWLNAARVVTVCSARRVMLTSDGGLYVRNVPGGMASGRYVTSSSNSAIRAMCDVYVDASGDGGSNATMSMGDDAVSRVALESSEYARRFTQELGITLTDIERCDARRFEFCSHLFNDGLPEHLRPFKAIARVVSHGAGDFPTKVARRVSLEHEWRHTPNAELYLAMLDSIAPIE